MFAVDDGFETVVLFKPSFVPSFVVVVVVVVVAVVVVVVVLGMSVSVFVAVVFGLCVVGLGWFLLGGVNYGVWW